MPSAKFEFKQSGWSIGDSNPGPLACQARASTLRLGVLKLESSRPSPSRTVLCRSNCGPNRGPAGVNLATGMPPATRAWEPGAWIAAIGSRRLGSDNRALAGGGRPEHRPLHIRLFSHAAIDGFQPEQGDRLVRQLLADCAKRQ